MADNDEPSPPPPPPSQAPAAPLPDIPPTVKQILQNIPLLRTRASPRDGAEQWQARLKEELQALIAYVKMNKAQDNDWFKIESNKQGTRWDGKCWAFYKGVRYEFTLHFEIPVSYPATSPDLCLPELDGKTAKMYRGGNVCLSLHFIPLWARNVPKFGIAHALALGLGPWLSVEVPSMVDAGMLLCGSVPSSTLGGGGGGAGGGAAK